MSAIRFLFIITHILCCIQVMGQQMPLNFTSDNNTFIGFAGSNFAFRTSNPASPTNRAGEFFNDGSSPWQGCFIDLNASIDLSENQILTERVMI